MTSLSSQTIVAESFRTVLLETARELGGNRITHDSLTELGDEVFLGFFEVSQLLCGWNLKR